MRGAPAVAGALRVSKPGRAGRLAARGALPLQNGAET